MKPIPLVLALFVFVARSDAQIMSATKELAAELTFEAPHTGSIPRGWGGGPPETIFLDERIVHGGRWSARLERSANSPQSFSTITKALTMDFAGSSIEWRGFLRTEDVSEFTGLWLREDGDSGAVEFDNMQQRQVKGTHEWTEYSITLPLNPRAKQVFFGVLVAGTGKVWADDLQLLIDGKAVWDAPKIERPKTPNDVDHEFDAGSHITLSQITKPQTENLAMLGKVWGFLKYHHPDIVSGRHQWDYDLFRVLPKVLAAGNREAADAAVAGWIRAMGDVPACTACIKPPDGDLQLRPDIGWIDREDMLGRDLSQLLQMIYQKRSSHSQFYVSLAQGIGNPVFEHELAYNAVKFPDAGYQLLALYRLWNIVEYWYPNRNILDSNWDDVLAEFVPRIALAKNKQEYELALTALIAKITDTHANLWSLPPQSRPPLGECQLPVITRFVENKAVVTGYSEAAAGPATGLKIGDVIDRLDGMAIPELIQSWRPYYPASNDAARLRDIGRAFTRGACTTVRADVVRGNQTIAVSAERIPFAKLDRAAEATHDLPGETFRLLSPDVAYLKLSSVQAGQAASYITAAKDTRGLIIDIRNYPSQFVPFAIGSLLVDRPTPFVRFTSGDLDNPGTFHWPAQPLMLQPGTPHYAGKVVILVDEVSQSEYTAMAFRASPRAVVVGSTTAGADGNVSEIPLPGGHRTMVSGLGVFYPDRKPTQRIGIVPDVEARPTIPGIRDGRDEVLEEGIRQILGDQTTADRIQKIAKP